MVTTTQQEATALILAMDALLAARLRFVSIDPNWDKWHLFPVAIESINAAVRFPQPAPLPQDVINLVIAAREVAYEDFDPEKMKALDKASEAFADRVPWDNEPEQFPQPSRKDGKEPCGECHIKPGEKCDICGAAQSQPGETVQADVQLVSTQADLVAAITSASHALRSYEFGNSSPDLAKSIADHCDVVLKRVVALKSEGASMGNLSELQKDKVLLNIIASAGSQICTSESPWSWLNWFCDDADPDTFNRCNEKGWLHTTHDGDMDVSTTTLTPSGRAAIAPEDGADAP